MNASGLRPEDTMQDQRLDYLLQQVTTLVEADVTCVYTFGQESNRLTLSTFQSREPVALDHWTEVNTWLEDHLALLNGNSQVSILPFSHENALGVRSLLIWPLGNMEALIGVVVLSSQQGDHFHEGHFDLLRPPLNLVRTVLENLYLTERLISTEAVATTAQVIARNPSPQNIVHALRDYLFDVHVSSCAIGLFGPVREDRPQGPFDYIEIEGAWSRRLGSKIGVGVRFDLRDYRSIFEQLQEHKILTLTDLENYLPEDADDFARMMIKVDGIQSVTLILLESERSKLGVIIIATDTPHEFDDHELRAYQIVGEFLAMSTMAAALQRQADFVQQGRAALLDAVTDGVIMVLPDEEATLLTANDHFSTMFGLREYEIQGSSLAVLLEKMQIPASVRRDLFSQWTETAHQNDKLTGEFRMTTRSGIQADIQWYSAPVYQDGEVLGRIYTFHDITPERTSERLRSELLSRISHELRTPLTSIRGFAEFILEVAGNDLPEIAREYTEIIHKSAIHLNHLFSDMIEITRANAGELKLDMRDADLRTTVRDVVTRMRPQSKERHQQIVLEVPESLPIAHVDTDRIDQVLTNLVSNAIKYSPEGSRVLVKLQYLTSQRAVPKTAPADVVTPCALVSVIDQGVGLSTEEVDKVFLPFYRTGEAKRAQIEGTGLGLAIAHSIVELHRGKIWAEPAQRRSPGGRFFFTIPTSD